MGLMTRDELEPFVRWSPVPAGSNKGAPAFDFGALEGKPAPTEERTEQRIDADGLEKTLSAITTRYPVHARFTTDELDTDFSRTYYFMTNAGTDGERDRFHRWSAVKSLRALREPDLRNAKAPAFRFYWWRAFEMPVTVRVEGGRGDAVLIAKMLRGRTNHTSTLCLRKERRLTTDEYDRLWGCLADPEVWQWRDEQHFDGSKRHVEAHIGDAHVYGYTRSPSDGALHACASLALDLAAVPTGPDGRY